VFFFVYYRAKPSIYAVADEKHLGLFRRQTVTDFLRTTAHSVKRVLAIVEACMCVCVYVCLSHFASVSKRCKLDHKFFTMAATRKPS